MSDPLFAGLAARFRDRALADGTRLRAALAESDCAKVGAIAHALSGSAGTFGFAAISAHAEALESAVDAGEAQLVEAAKPLLAALDALA